MRTHLFFLFVLLAGCRQQGAERSAPSAKSVASQIMAAGTAAVPVEQKILMLDSLMPIVRATADNGLQAELIRCKAVAWLQVGDYPKADSLLTEAAYFFTVADSTNKHFARLQLSRASYFNRTSQFDSAIHYAVAGYELTRKYDTTQLALACIYVGDAYAFAGDTSHRYKYIRQGLALSPPPAYRQHLLNQLTMYFIQRGFVDSAKATHRQILDDPTSDPVTNAVNEMNMGLMLSEGGDFENAIPILESSLVNSRKLGVEDELNYLNLGEAYFNSGNMARAAANFDTAAQYAQQSGDVDLLSNIYRNQSVVAARQGNFQKAFNLADSANLYHLKLDSLQYLSKIQELDRKLDANQKDDQILKLDLAHQKAVVSNQRRTSIIVGMALVLAMGGLVFYLVVKRQRLHAIVRQYQLEQQLLRARMDPHFVLNSIAHLQGHIRADQKELSLGYLKHLGRLLKTNLLNAAHSLVPLVDEIEALESYIELQAFNYKGRFEYEMVLYPGYSNDGLKIPPMLLQPFVENAFEHGLASAGYRGKLRVEVTKSDRHLKCVIEDNGLGLSNTESRKWERPSLSTTITSERLAILHYQTGIPASVTVTDRKVDNQQGVRVELLVPFVIDSGGVGN